MVIPEGRRISTSCPTRLRRTRLRLADLLTRLDVDLLGMDDLTPELGYAELEQRAFEERAFGQPVRICGFDDLIAMKRATGRPEDLLDLQRLSEARSGG